MAFFNHPFITLCSLLAFIILATQSANSPQTSYTASQRAAMQSAITKAAYGKAKRMSQGNAAKMVYLYGGD